MKHFLEISQLNSSELASLIQRALEFKAGKNIPAYSQQPVAALFYENSTRTRISFELAAGHLSMPFIDVNPKTSSESKGETIQDTLLTLNAMGISLFVIRHQQDHLPAVLANDLQQTAIQIINAGDGCHAHPSQALLDIVTIVEQKPNLSQLKITIVGDILHSRVASSLQMMFKTLGVADLRLVSPSIWQPENALYGTVSDNLSEAVEDADVIICLRVQKERLAENEHLDLQEYQNHYMLSNRHLEKARPDAMIMHPGPVNRGIEINAELADCQQSFILKQVQNGVFARMAIYDALIKSMNHYG